MFQNLSDNLGKVFSKLKGKGFLSEDDVNAAMREVRIALLEADVALPVVKDFIARVKEKAVGEEVVKKVNPAQMVIKIVNDELVAMLGSETSELNLKAAPPAVIMMVGLQGSGKTTSTAKIALNLKQKSKKKALLASLDVSRPAAQEQLETLGKQIDVDTVEIIKGQTPKQITKRALDKAKKEGYDIVMLDTAGRLHIDDELMAELKEVRDIGKPVETLLVADSLTGQDAVNVAKEFNEKIGVTGIVLTRLDGDGRGGAALSMKEITGCPIKFAGIGEKMSELEEFHPDRIASRILGMGDIVSLVEKASDVVEKEEAEALAKKMRKGVFDFNDLLKQLESIKKMGGVGGIMGMMPGMGKLRAKAAEAGVDESMIEKQKAIINSMTKKERENPKLMGGSRKKRIAAGSGTSVQDINRLIKMQKQMQVMMKKLGKMGPKGLGRMMKGMMPNG
jgi:signal recognition particle subunit SRP54